MRLHPKLRDLDRRHPILGLMALNGLAGATAALVVVGGLLLLDVGGLWTLMASSEVPALPIAMMTAAFMITLSGAAMSVAIMRIGQDGGGEGEFGTGVPVPARVRAERPARQRFRRD